MPEPLVIKNFFTEYFFIRLLINTVSMFILVKFIYLRLHKKKDLLSPFFIMNFVLFLLTYMMKSSTGLDSFGSSIGLLAAFTLLRFRTETISMKDMTYLFVVMSIGLINSIMTGTYLEIIALNGIITTVVYAADGSLIFRDEKVKSIEMEGLDHIRPEDHAKLIETLRARTGLNITKISIDDIDFGKKKATIKIYYF